MEAQARTPAIVKRRGSKLALPFSGAGAALAAALGWQAGVEGPRPAVPAEAFASPIVIDLNADGVHTAPSQVVFDIDGDGRPDRHSDVDAADGVLVFDADGDGVSGESGRELLGDKADTDGDGKPDLVSDGFEALTALALEAAHRGWVSQASLRSGRLDAAELRGLEAGLGLKVRVGGFRGHDVPLREAGIHGLRLPAGPSRRKKAFDPAGNDLSERDGAVWLDAEQRAAAYADLWLRYRSALLPDGALTSAR